MYTTMKYFSILVFIALLSPRHVVLADQTTRRHLRGQQQQQAHGTTRRLMNPKNASSASSADASPVDKKQRGKRDKGRKKGRRKKRSRNSEATPNDNLEPITNDAAIPTPTLPAPSTNSPTKRPTMSPVTTDPTSKPSTSPSGLPSRSPNNQIIQLDEPITLPVPSSTSSPTKRPSISPVTTAPTSKPSASPSISPSRSPSNPPSHLPTMQPTKPPSAAPSSKPTQAPSSSPTQVPSTSPSSTPTLVPTNKPTLPDCDPIAIEYSNRQYDGGDKVLYSNEEGITTFVCMFNQCQGIEGKEPGRWGGWGMGTPFGYCVPLTKAITIDDLTTKPSIEPDKTPEVSSSGCPAPWTNSANYNQNDFASAIDTAGTNVIYKCYKPVHCKTIAPGGKLSEDAWFVDGVCLDDAILGL